MEPGESSTRTFSSVRYAILRNARLQAVKWRMLQGNPADAVDLPRQETRPLTEDEAGRFLAATKGPPFHTFFALLPG